MSTSHSMCLPWCPGCLGRAKPLWSNGYYTPLYKKRLGPILENKLDNTINSKDRLPVSNRLKWWIKTRLVDLRDQIP